MLQAIQAMIIQVIFVTGFIFSPLQYLIILVMTISPVTIHISVISNIYIRSSGNAEVRTQSFTLTAGTETPVAGKQEAK